MILAARSKTHLWRILMTSTADSNHPRLGVGVIILRNKQVLLGRRKGVRSPGTYGLPGGYLENNETFEECAIREVFEETGLRCLSFRPMYLISGTSDNAHFADIIFYTNCENGKPIVREIDRVEKWEWFDLFSLPTSLYNPTKLALKNFLANYKFHKIKLFLQRWFPEKRVTILYVDSVTRNEIISK